MNKEKLKSLHVDKEHHYYFKLISLKTGQTIKTLLEETAKKLMKKHKIKDTKFKK